MKSTGITRPVDNLGRIVLPMELRRAMDIQPGDRLEIFTERNTIILRKYEKGCIFCDSITDSIYGGKRICSGCIEKLRKG